MTMTSDTRWELEKGLKHVATTIGEIDIPLEGENAEILLNMKHILRELCELLSPIIENIPTISRDGY